MNSNADSPNGNYKQRNLPLKNDAGQGSVKHPDGGDNKQFLLSDKLILPGFLVLVLIGWFGTWFFFSNFREVLLAIALLIGLVGAYPLTYIAYRDFGAQAQRDLLKNDFRLLGLVSEDKIETVEELYLTVYSRTQFIVYISLIIIQSLLILAGYLNRESLTLMSAETMTLIFYSYLGASVFSIQQVVRRYNTFDLQPQVYSSISARIFLAAVITFVGASVIIFSGGQLANKSGTLEPQAWAAVLAFVIGVFPNRGLRWFLQQTSRILNTPTDQANERPVKHLLGISTWHEARLSEMGIDDAQNLATADMRKLLLTTQFDTQEIIHWIDQAILYIKVGQKIDRFRDAKMTTFHEFRLALGSLTLDPFTELTKQDSNKRDEPRKRLATVLGMADTDELDRLSDYSNFPNYAHIAEYYSRTVLVARQHASVGMETLIGDIQETNFKRAIENAKRLLLQNPNDSKVLTNLGVAYYELAQRDKTYSPQERLRALDNAFSAFSRAIKYDERIAKAYYSRSMIYLDKEEYDKAVQDCTRAIEIDLTHAAAFNNRGLAYMHMGYLDLAISDFTEALQLNDSLTNAYYNRGYAHSEQGNYGIALKDFEKANSLEYPGDPLFWFRWGETLLKIGVNFEDTIKIKDAIKKLSNAIAHDINFTRAYASRGYAYLQLDKKHYREARSDLDRVLKTLGDKDKSLLVDVHNNLGRLEARENNYSVAIHHYQEALKINPNYYITRYHLAQAYKDSNQLEAALAEFKCIAQTAPFNSTEAEQSRKLIACLETNHKTVVINEESI